MATTGVKRRWAVRVLAWLRRRALAAATAALGVVWLGYLASFATLVSVSFAERDVPGSGMASGTREVWCANGVLMVRWLDDYRLPSGAGSSTRASWQVDAMASPAWREGLSRMRGYVTIDWRKRYGHLYLGVWVYPWPDEVRGVGSQFRIRSLARALPTRAQGAALPLWPLMLGCTGLVVWRWRRRASRHATACRACGYSLEGLEGRVVCPECGRAQAQ